MSRLRFRISTSLDGFIAGPNQSLQNPLGVGGNRLHEWAYPLRAFREMHGQQGGEVNESNAIIEEAFEDIGATIMGRTCSAAARVHCAVPTELSGKPVVFTHGWPLSADAWDVGLEARSRLCERHT